jgi:DNA-binding HxlR family transcriptional regulator
MQTRELGRSGLFISPLMLGGTSSAGPSTKPLGELQLSVGISQKVLIQQFKELEKDGLVRR